MPTHKEQIFNTQIGQAATVGRQEISGELVTKSNKDLLEIGALSNPLPTNLKHMGSAALHVYWNETLEQVYFVNQVSTMHGCPEQLAIAGSKDFMGTMIEFFTGKRPKLRSGF